MRGAGVLSVCINQKVAFYSSKSMINQSVINESLQWRSDLNLIKCKFLCLKKKHGTLKLKIMDALKWKVSAKSEKI